MMSVSRSALLGLAAAIAFSQSQLVHAAANTDTIECRGGTTPVCLHWVIGPPAQCTEWGCGATKPTDPPKAVQGTIGTTSGGKTKRFPIVTGITGLKHNSTDGTATFHSTTPKTSTLQMKTCLDPKKCH